MATDKKISTLVQSQLPQYLTEEGPNLVAFLKAYYEWMETTGQATDASKNLLVNRDIDTTDLNKFYEYFRREVLSQFPQAMLADKKLVTKRIKDLYLSKGTRSAYKLLFRILFNEDVTVYDPKENILRASDGRWRKDTLLRLGGPFSGNIDDIVSLSVTGQTSGATGRVVEALTVFESGVEVKELRLTEVTGTFQDLEQVLALNGTGGSVINTVGPLQRVVIGNAGTSGGTGHQVGDLVNLTSARGSGASGVVTQTSDEVVTFVVVDGGSGFTVGSTVLTVSGGSPAANDVIGSATVASITNTETITAFTDQISGLKDTPIGHGTTYSSNSGIISSNLASSNASTTLGSALGTLEVTAGSIETLNVTVGNYIDNLPVIRAFDTRIAPLEISDGSGGIKGRNATLAAQFTAGSLKEIDVTNSGTGYNATFSIDIINQTRTGTVSGHGAPVVTGVLSDIGGYTSTKGFLSWDQHLRDNYYYQEYSYLLKSSKTLKAYRDVVEEVLHPAGTKLFGQVEFKNTIDLTGLAVEQFLSLDLIGGKNGVPSIQSTTSFGTPTALYEINVPSISQTTFGTISIGTFVTPTSITSTAIVTSNFILEFNPTLTGIASTLSFGNIESDRDITTTSTLSTETHSTDAIVYLNGGNIYVSNNNVIGSYLTHTVEGHLTDPVLLGTPVVVHGDGTSDFSGIVVSGSEIEIEDVIPGTEANTTYIVDTIYSNTTLTLSTEFAGQNMANGILRYIYDGNI